MARAVLGLKSRLKQKAKAAHGKEIEIQVDKETHLPSKAWERLREFHPIHQLPTDYFLNQPCKLTSLRFVCISNTHGAIEHLRREYHSRIPNGDVLIHCGDFTMGGDPSEIIRFDSFICECMHFFHSNLMSVFVGFFNIYFVFWGSAKPVFWFSRFSFKKF